MARQARRQPPHSQRFGPPWPLPPLAPGTAGAVVSAVTPTLVPGPVSVLPSTPALTVASAGTGRWYEDIPQGTASVVVQAVMPTWLAEALSPWRQRRRVPVVVR